MADDEESLDDILSPKGTTTPEIESTEAEPEVTDPPRDEHGRFAPKQEQEAEPEAEQEEPPEAAEHEGEPDKRQPPPGVLEERRKRQAAEQERETLARELAELRGTVNALMQRGNQPTTPQPQPEPAKAPDCWESPDQYVAHQLTPVQQELAEMRFRTSRAEAFAECGKETVSAAEAAIKQAVQSGELNGQAVAAQLQKSRDPVGDVVRWHQNSPAVREASLRDKLRAEIMAELGHDPSKPAPSSTPSTRTPIVKVPPSLSRVPAGHSVPERDESLDEVLSQPRRARA